MNRISEELEEALNRLAKMQKDLNKRDGLATYEPNGPATPNAISQAERAAGITFSDEFKSVLSTFDGWREFFIEVDLLGTKDFLEGRHKKLEKLEEYHNYLRINGLKDGAVIVGGSEDILPVIIHISATSPIIPNYFIFWDVKEQFRCKSFVELVNWFISEIKTIP